MKLGPTVLDLRTPGDRVLHAAVISRTGGNLSSIFESSKSLVSDSDMRCLGKQSRAEQYMEAMDLHAQREVLLHPLHLPSFQNHASCRSKG